MSSNFYWRFELTKDEERRVIYSLGGPDYDDDEYIGLVAGAGGFTADALTAEEWKEFSHCVEGKYVVDINVEIVVEPWLRDWEDEGIIGINFVTEKATLEICGQVDERTLADLRKCYVALFGEQ